MKTLYGIPIAEFVKILRNVTTVKILPYHNYAGSKYEALHMENTLPAVLPTDDEIKKAQQPVDYFLE